MDKDELLLEYKCFVGLELTDNWSLTLDIGSKKREIARSIILRASVSGSTGTSHTKWDNEGLLTDAALFITRCTPTAVRRTAGAGRSISAENG
jgi:hypothetical protein